jgi:hypothetical protein
MGQLGQTSYLTRFPENLSEIKIDSVNGLVVN